MTSIDMREVSTLAQDLGRIAGGTVPAVDAVLERGALNVKNRMAADAQQHTGYARRFASSISYDRAAKLGALGYEVGPDKDHPQGALGNLMYFGSRNNGPVLDIEAGLVEEEPRLIKALGDVLVRALDA